MKREKKTKDKIDMLTDTVASLKDELTIAIKQQNEMANSMSDAIGMIQKQMIEITKTQNTIQEIFMNMSNLYTMKNDNLNVKFGKQEEHQEYESIESDNEREMEFSMTDLKRARENRSYDAENIKITKYGMRRPQNEHEVEGKLTKKEYKKTCTVTSLAKVKVTGHHEFRNNEDPPNDGGSRKKHETINIA